MVEGEWLRGWEVVEGGWGVAERVGSGGRGWGVAERVGSGGGEWPRGW